MHSGPFLAQPPSNFTKGNAMTIRALAIVTALALPALAIADDQPKPTDKTNEKTTNAPAPVKGDKAAKLSDGDVKIVAHLHHVNQMEIEMGKLARRPARPPSRATPRPWSTIIRPTTR